MSAATQPTDFSDLYTALLNKAREATTATATLNQAKRHINTALYDMHIGFDAKVPWAERRSTLITRAHYTTGTVSISQGSTTLTGASTVWTTTDVFSIANVRAGGKMIINGTEPIYEVSSVDSATSITLATRYVDSDVAAGSSYIYFEDEYALASDFLRPLAKQFGDDRMAVPIIERSEFRNRFPRNYSPGRPRACTILDLAVSGNTTPVRKVAFAPTPNDTWKIDYQYITSNLGVTSAGVAQAALSSDTDEPIVPIRYRNVIVLHALYNWYRDKKDDARSQEAKAEYVDLMGRIASDHETGQNKPRIQPRIGPYLRAAKRPWRGGLGRFDVNGRFDRLDDR